jgi:GT2 family glycosyltransferase
MSWEVLAYFFSNMSKDLSSFFLQTWSKRSPHYRTLFRFVDKTVISGSQVTPFTPRSLPKEVLTLGQPNPTVSVIICTYNRAEFLKAALSALAKQRYRNFEVVVVNGPSTDQTDEVIEAWANRIKVAACPERNVSLSRNIGVSIAKGDVLGFLDDDAVPEPDWIEMHLSAMKRLGAVGTGGPIRNPDGMTFQCRRLVANSLADVRLTFDRALDEPLQSDWRVTLTGTNLFIQRRAVIAVGGFDENFRYFLDETDILRRIALQGGQLGFTRDAEVQHYRGENIVRSVQTSVPDYSTILSSLAYYCLRHRRPGAADDRINDRIVRELQKLARHLRRARGSGALDVTAARSAWRTALKALRSFKGGDSLFPQSRLLDRAPPFKTFAVDYGVTRRYAIVDDHASDASCSNVYALALDLAAKGCEVTVLLAPARRGAVRFGDGVWWHRPQQRWRFGFSSGDQARANSIAELQRLKDHRKFEWVITASNLDGGVEFNTSSYAAFTSRPKSLLMMLADRWKAALRFASSSAPFQVDSLHGEEVGRDPPDVQLEDFAPRRASSTPRPLRRGGLDLKLRDEKSQ